MTLPMAKNNKTEKPIISALEGKATKTAPFWLMRQAGRYLPEYRELRKDAGSFLRLCMTPEHATEITIQPLRRFDMDAAILFSDILVIPYALGQELNFVEGEGPQLGSFSFDNLNFTGFDQKLSPVYETVRNVRKELSDEKTLIGFAGAPWTVACYMIEGRGGGVFEKAVGYALGNQDKFDALISLLVEATVRYLNAQVAAGADALQLFDSWAGLVPEGYFERWVIKPARQIVDVVKKQHPHVKIIGFPREAGKNYKAYAEKTGVDGVSLDHSLDLAAAVKEFGGKVCLQGNLDPEILLKGGKEMEQEVLRILNITKNQPFIFNLGHGVIKETPPEHVADLARIIRSFQR